MQTVSSALDMQREEAISLANVLVRIAPAGSIACIFAGGSLGRGEVWAAEANGATEIYSDIDLYVVAQNDAVVNAIREQVWAIYDMMRPRGFAKGPDIGVYTRADLAAQPVRPGTADLDTHHLMLYGDESIPRGLRDRTAAHIAPEEALYLLENRAWEVRGPSLAAMDNSFARLFLVASLKAQLDVYSAHAIVDGTFATTLAERAVRFHKSPPATLVGEARARVARAFDAARDIGAWMRDRSGASEEAEARHALVEAWRTLAPNVLRMQGSVPALIARRCRAGEHMANARDVVRIRRGTSRSMFRAMLAAPMLSSRAPLPSLRVHALVSAFAREDKNAPAFAAHFLYVDWLTRSFGYVKGSLESRVSNMHARLS